MTTETKAPKINAITMVDPALIVIRDGWNSRDFSDVENVAHVNALADSIRENGVKEPLTVYIEDGKMILTNGESRLRAVRLLLSQGVAIAGVPVQTEPKNANEVDFLASQIIRNSGKPLTLLEQAALFRKLIGHGLTEKDIAAKAGYTNERIRQILTLNQATPDVAAEVKAGTIAATTVQRIIAAAKSRAEISETVKAAVEKARSEGKAKATQKHVDKVENEKRVRQGGGAPVKGGKKLAAVAKTVEAAKALAAGETGRVDYKGLLAQLVSYQPESVPASKDDDGVEIVTLTLPKDVWAAIEAAVG